MYTANSRKTTNFFKSNVIDMLTEDRKWNNQILNGNQRRQKKRRKFNKLETADKRDEQKILNMVDINLTRSIITVNVNKQIKRHILSDQILEKYSIIYYIQKSI